MNLFRIHRKSKHKIKFKTIFLFIFSLIMTTFAWFAYSKVLDSNLKFHIASWDLEYSVNGSPKTNEIGIEIPILHPTMAEKSVKIDIKNNGEKTVEIDYRVDSVTIVGVVYDIVYEGQQNPTGNYILLGPSVIETSSVVEDDITIITKTVKGSIIKDTERFPFTVDVEHSYQIEPDGGQGYLRVDVNWVGDNNKLDSEWGYIVGEYFTENESATSAMSIELTIDAYQQEDLPTERTVTMPSTSETNPYLPTGFTRVPGTTLETGLTIKDSSGNEYVWIEVPKTTTVYPNAGLSITSFSDSEYDTIESDLHLYTADYRNETLYKDEYYSDETTGLTSDEYNQLKNKMLKSIYQNGGFYVGKYETGTATARTTSSDALTTAVIQQHSYPYNFVTCAQAQTLAGNMESGDHTSSLMFGVQWDLVLKYLETKGTERGTTNKAQLNENSIEWGNYKDSLWTVTNSNAKYTTGATSYAWTEEGVYGEKEESAAVLLTTGASSTFSKQGIYDLAGNVWEFTLEYTYDLSYPCSRRAGYYENLGSYSQASCRNGNSITGFDKNIGFRVTIY